MRKGWRTAFTLIELLVVVAILALLLSILLPSLSGAREQAKKVKCLSNLSNIAKGMYSYANDDSAEQIIPIHMNMMRSRPYWDWKTIQWCAWGGRSGQRAFLYQVGADGWLLDESIPAGMSGVSDAIPDYAASRRPLNIYMLGDIGTGDSKKLEWFQCPSDTGYPDDKLIDDSPAANAERSCYDTLGNSYRASMACHAYAPQNSSSTGAFAIGPWGHRLTSLVDAGRLVLMGEPTWFNMIGQDISGGADDVKVMGWHKKKMVDNLAYCDGSARATKAEKAQNIDTEAMGVDPDAASSLHRGTGFRLDVYPVGGARIFGNWSSQLSTKADLWPWKNFQDNLRAP